MNTETKLNKKNIKMWVEALRSGKYTQGKNYLMRCDSNTYCCLGVACDISKIKYEEVYKKTAEDTFVKIRHYKDIVDKKYYERLPSKVTKWLGIDEDDPIVNIKGKMHRLTDLNDILNYNFDKIANAIENTYLRGENK